MERQSERRPVKVLLVEDEPIILSGLARLVDWPALGFEVAGTAQSYDEALSQAYLHKPDLVITDIMLGEGQNTGLDLVKKLRPLMPRTKAVLLTGYDSFEYAKEAIRYTVKAYLLKPVDQATLAETLANLKKEIYAEWDAEAEKAALSQQVQAAMPFLFDWLMTFPGGDGEEALLDLPAGATGYTVIVASFAEGQPGGDQALYSTYIELGALRAVYADGIRFFFRHAQFVCLLCHRGGGQIEDMNQRSYELAQEIQQFLDFHGLVDYVVGVGRSFPGAGGIATSYDQALRACRYQHFMGMSKLVCFADLALFPEAPMVRLRDVWEELAVAVRSGDEAALEEIIRRVFEQAAAQDPGIARLRGLGYESMVLLDEVREEITAGEAEAGAAYGEAIAASQTLPALVDYVLENYRRVAGLYSQKRQRRNSAALGQVLAIIERDYAAPLSLEGLAKAVYLSPSYLSYLFSLEMGKTFKTHLTDVRMEKAAELLGDLSLKVYEVAERVGYTDTRYFGQVFKRATGLTPLQFRNQQG